MSGRVLPLSSSEPCARRGALLSALEEILKSESDPERRKVARRRYLDLTDPKEESHVTDRA